MEGKWWHRLDDGRIQCDLCPRDCRLHEGQRGLCFVRKMEGGRMVLTTYGRSSGSCIDPVIFAEYAMDIADACRARGVKTVAVTAGYIHPEPRRAFYEKMDAANVDLKAFTDEFYFKICGGRLQPVLDTLEYLVHETSVWTEITTLLIPGKNDSDEELKAECKWIRENLGPDVPVHFTAFHPDWKMTDIPHTPAATLTRAREIAQLAGLNYVYTGNVHDEPGGSTYCPSCEQRVIRRDWYDIRGYQLDDAGACKHCGTRLPGRFQKFGKPFGPRRIPVRLETRV